MATTVPSTEPNELRAGDTWQWRRDDLTDYPAPAWVLTYYLRNATQHFDITAGADGINHAVTVAKAATAAFTAGVYDWVAVVSNSTERHEIGHGRLSLLPDFAAATALESRSFARQLLDAVEAALLKRASTDQLDVIDATLADRGMKRSDGGLLKLRTQLIAEVKREENAEAMRKGNPSRNRVLVRFSNV